MVEAAAREMATAAAAKGVVGMAAGRMYRTSERSRKGPDAWTHSPGTCSTLVRSRSMQSSKTIGPLLWLQQACILGRPQRSPCHSPGASIEHRA